jgi:homoprotocatechuate degradation regulator HpaR
MSRKPARPRHRSLPLLLLQAREQLMWYFRPILNAHGLTEQQWRIVRVLLDVESLEPREIGALCRISSPSLAGVLARMEELGLVTRERLEHDQRRVRVSLTTRSRALAARMTPQIDAAYLQIEERMGRGFSARLERMLDQLLAALEPSADTSDAARARLGRQAHSFREPIGDFRASDRLLRDELHGRRG